MRQVSQTFPLATYAKCILLVLSKSWGKKKKKVIKLHVRDLLLGKIIFKQSRLPDQYRNTSSVKQLELLNANFGS